VISEVICHHLFFCLVGHSNSCVSLKAMDVIFPSARIGSNMEELCIGITAADVCEPRPLPDPRFFNGCKPHTTGFETPAEIELLECKHPSFLRQL